MATREITARPVGVLEDEVAPWMPQRTLRGHTDPVVDVAFSADGRLLASAGAGEHETVRVWEGDGGALVRTLAMGGPAVSVSFSPDGGMLAAAGGTAERGLWLWELKRGKCRWKRKLTWADQVVAGPDGRLLASVDGSGAVRVHDLKHGRERRTLVEETCGGTGRIAFSPDGTLLAAGGGLIDGTVRIWDPETGASVLTLEGHTCGVEVVAFSPDGRLLASGSGRMIGQSDLTIRLWDLATGVCLQILAGHTEKVEDLAFAPDGTLLASAAYDQTIRLWDTASGRCLQVLAPTEDVRSLAFHPGGKLLACAVGNVVEFWAEASSGATRSVVDVADELIELDRRINQLATSGEAKDSPRWSRCDERLNEIGRELYARGGESAMREALTYAYLEGLGGRYAEREWTGIGGWMG